MLVFDEDKPLALLCEAALMQEWGGRTVIVPRIEGYATSAIVQRLAPPAAVWA